MKEYRNPEMLVSTEWLKANLEDPDIRVVEVSSIREQTYDDGHIPGAILWPWRESLWDSTTRDFVGPGDFSELMMRSGIGPETTIVLYSSMCQFATYALWTCIRGGHEKVRILNGSRTLWEKENQPLSAEVPEITRSEYPVRDVNERWRIGRDDLLSGLGKPGRVILDGRTDDEYNGLRVKPLPGLDHGAERKGHIPGARHLYFRELLNEDDTFKTAEELEQLFNSRGADSSKEIISYCRLSHRATLLWFTAKYLLGYPNVRSYDGSWTEWGSMVGMPIELPQD